MIAVELRKKSQIQSRLDQEINTLEVEGRWGKRRKNPQIWRERWLQNFFQLELDYAKGSRFNVPRSENR